MSASTTIPEELIRDPATFSRLSAECDKIIDTQRLLPDFVFWQAFPKYLATEYACLYGKDAAILLSQMSRTFGDESVNFMTIDPHPVDCYYKRNSWFGLASFSSATVSERYVPIMYAGTFPKLLAGVNVGAYWGSSMKWAIFADRLRWELALIATQDNIEIPTIGRFRYFTAPMIASYMRSQYQSKDPSGAIASDFAARFLPNYAI